MRTVITVQSNGEIDPVTNSEQLVVTVDRHPQVFPGMTKIRRLPLSPWPAWGEPDAVALRGRLLRDALRKHDGIAAVLDSLGRAPDGAQAPLYVKLTEGEAELIAWETLCDASDKFVALDRRWPIGRITDPASTVTRAAPVFRVPVRIALVIAAFGIEGQVQEWEMVRDAADEARDRGLPVEVMVLTGDPVVHQQVTQDIAAGRAWATAGGVDDSGEKVLSTLRRWQPNIVHFFCHGHAGDREQSLELATANDMANPAGGRGSVLINGDQLASFGGRLDNPWLLVLNCCEGAQACKESLSLAHRVVSSAFPAAFAMLEPVDAADAHEFTRAIYDSLLEELRGVKKALGAGDPVSFEWATITHGARDAINARHQGMASTQREWALPALYVRGVDAMEFRMADEDATDAIIAAQKEAVETTLTWLQSVSDSLSEERRQEALAKALTSLGIPKSMWPNPDGTVGRKVP